MDPSKLFRKAALERLSSPERLDVTMRVTAPTAWLALAALGAVLIMLVVWSVVGEIAIKVRGQGILLRGEALHEVTSSAYGRLSQVLVEKNQTVREGEVVARLDQPELDEKIRAKRAELESLMAQAENQRRSQNRIINRLEAQAAELRQSITSQETLVEKGLLTSNAVLATRQQLTATEREISSIQSSLVEYQNRIEDARRQLDGLQQQLGSSAEVTSHFTGRIIEVTANVGDLMSPGTRLLTLEAFEEPIEAVIFVPAADGKKIRPGMTAQISPSTVRAEEWGFIIGEVEGVSDFPVTPEGLSKVLRNQQLVTDLTGSSAPIEVNVKLIEDPTTESGFKWSSSKGPPMKVFSGTLCTASVTVDEKRPVSYVLPIFRKTLGMS